ncbi:MAG: DMT family transporter [Candidatus Micrarchaeota archaeon]|nr:DMT family transporter [Candidatus Micrarchaeota archaeon]
MNTTYKAAFALAFLVVLYTFYTIALQIGGSTVGLIPQLFYAFFVAFIVSSALSFAMNRGRGFISIVRNPKLLVLVVILGLVNNPLSQLSLGLGTLGTNPSIASIVYRSWIIIVALLTPLVLRQKIKRMQLVATVIGFAGLYLVVSGGTLFSFNYNQLPYIGLVLLAALSSVALTLVYSKYSFDIFGAMVLFNLASLALLGSLAAMTNTTLAIGGFPPSAFFTVLLYGALGFGIASSLYYYSVKAVGPNVVGNVFLVIPFLTIFLAAVFANTPIQPYYLVAALLISTGIMLQRRYSVRQERVTKNKLLDRLTIFDVTGVFISNRNPAIAQGIAGENRAFAIRLSRNAISRKAHADVFSKYGCVSFTNQKPHKSTTSEEIRSVAEAMKLRSGETALIGLGNPDKLEGAFAEFVSSREVMRDLPESSWKVNKPGTREDKG